MHKTSSNDWHDRILAQANNNNIEEKNIILLRENITMYILFNINELKLS